MTTTQKTNALGVGAAGSEFVPHAYADGVQGLFDRERHGHASLKLSNGNKARDVSPTRLQLQDAAAGKSRADADAQNIANLFTRAADAEVFKKVPGGVTVVAFDDPSSVIGPAKAFQKRLRAQRLLALTDPGDAHDQRCPVRDAVPGASPFTAIGHTSDRSPFAQANSPRRQGAFTLNAYNALTQAPATYEHNPTLGEVVESLGEWGPCFHFGHASLPLAAAGGAFWEGARRFVGGRYTRASVVLNDVLAQGGQATVLALRPENQTTNQAVDVEGPLYVLYIAPFSKGPTLTEFLERQAVWLTQNVPTAKAIFAAGNGVPLLEDRGQRFIQVSVLSPLQMPAKAGG